jgi:hypothetical protein
VQVDFGDAREDRKHLQPSLGSWIPRQAFGNDAFDRAYEVPGLCFRNDLGYPGGASGLGQRRHIEHRKQYEGDFRIEGDHTPGGFEAVHIGHGEINENQIRFQLAELFNSCLTGLSFTTYSPISRMDNRSKDAARSFGIIHNQDAQFHRGRV